MSNRFIGEEGTLERIEKKSFFGGCVRWKDHMRHDHRRVFCHSERSRGISNSKRSFSVSPSLKQEEMSRSGVERPRTRSFRRIVRDVSATVDTIRFVFGSRRF